MHFWGYANHPTHESPTQFETYADQTEGEIAMYRHFEKLNEEVLADPKLVQPWQVNQGSSLIVSIQAGLVFTSQNEIIEVKNP